VRGSQHPNITALRFVAAEKARQAASKPEHDNREYQYGDYYRHRTRRLSLSLLTQPGDTLRVIVTTPRPLRPAALSTAQFVDLIRVLVSSAHHLAPVRRLIGPGPVRTVLAVVSRTIAAVLHRPVTCAVAP
jgi:hypothetical protein